MLFLFIALFAIIFAYFWFVVERAPRRPIPGQRVLVTGGSSGIGLSTAIKLVQKGAHVVIVGRRQNVIDDALKTINEACRSGAKAYGFSADVSDEAAVSNLVKFCVDKMGGQ